MDPPRGWRRALLLLRTGPDQVRPALPHIARVTLAVLLGFVAARLLLDEARPIIAPLTALLVVQTTVYATFASAFQRVVAVVVGVLLAVGIASVFAFTWWTLGLVVAASLVVARILRLEGQELEVPISAMLVLAVGSSSEAAATARVLETIVGGAVGIALNLALGSPTRVGGASEAIASISEGMEQLLRRMADDLRTLASYEEAESWARDARALVGRLPQADRLVTEAEESLRLNPRASDLVRTGWSLRPRVDALVAAALSLLPLTRALSERILREPEEEMVYTSDVRRALTSWLELIADAVDAFGPVAASPTVPSPIASARLSEALEAAQAMRPRVADLLLVDGRADPDAWETHGALVLHAERLLEDLDIDRYARVREAWLEERTPLLERPQQVAHTVARSTRRVRDRLPVAARWRGWARALVPHRRRPAVRAPD